MRDTSEWRLKRIVEDLTRMTGADIEVRREAVLEGYIKTIVDVEIRKHVEKSVDDQGIDSMVEEYLDAQRAWTLAQFADYELRLKKLKDDDHGSFRRAT